MYTLTNKDTATVLAVGFKYGICSYFAKDKLGNTWQCEEGYKNDMLMFREANIPTGAWRTMDVDELYERFF